MIAKRIFHVYQEEVQIHSGPYIDHQTKEEGVYYSSKPFDGSTPCPNWCFSIMDAIDRRVVGISKEYFPNMGHAMEAARREASFYAPGMAAVEVEQ